MLASRNSGLARSVPDVIEKEITRKIEEVERLLTKLHITSIFQGYKHHLHNTIIC